MRLTNYFIRRKVKALAGQVQSRKRCFRSLADARNILVLYHADDQDIVEPCLKTLRALNKKVNVCMYVSGGTVLEEGPSQMLVNAITDLDMWYIPSDAVCKKFNLQEADILIDLTRGGNYAMHYLLLNHPCSFRVGARNRDLDMYDLTISMTNGDDIKYLFEQILFYLQTIRSK